MATMKALVKARPEPGLWLEEVPLPPMGINDVLIKIRKTHLAHLKTNAPGGRAPTPRMVTFR